MGIGILGGSSGPSCEGYKPVKGNPDPTNFKILATETIGHHTICVVNYPETWTFEGTKVLLYRNMTSEEVRNLRTMDPHFSAQLPAPFARFEPTPDGITAARFMARFLPPGVGSRDVIKVCMKCGRAGWVASTSMPICADCVGKATP